MPLSASVVRTSSGGSPEFDAIEETSDSESETQPIEAAKSGRTGAVDLQGSFEAVVVLRDRFLCLVVVDLPFISIRLIKATRSTSPLMK